MCVRVHVCVCVCVLIDLCHKPQTHHSTISHASSPCVSVVCVHGCVCVRVHVCVCVCVFLGKCKKLQTHHTTISYASSPCVSQQMPASALEAVSCCTAARLDPKLCPANCDLLAYVSGCDLWVTNLATGHEKRLTYAHQGNAAFHVKGVSRRVVACQCTCVRVSCQVLDVASLRVAALTPG